MGPAGMHSEQKSELGLEGLMSSALQILFEALLVFACDYTLSIR